jgi:hypothetical protein
MTIEYEIRNGRRIAVEVIEPKSTPKHRRQQGLHIGCPLSWLRRVLPLIATKEQLAVAIWLHRRRVICGGEPFSVPNKALTEELGIGRLVKYRVLQRLERAGAIVVMRNGKQAPLVRIPRVRG